jgi:TrmH family RNA methyltransferase
MLSKNKIKLITSLKQKKYRDLHGLFVVEGIKGIKELLHSHFELYSLYTIEEIFSDIEDEYSSISEKDLQKISFLKTPNKALAVFKIPKTPEISKIDCNTLVLALDHISDPGNLGTIIRLCDWFGITNLVCSKQTVDCYNPKVVQATMGSITRVTINYMDLVDFIKSQKDLPVFGAFMNGNNIYKETNLPNKGILVLGNEANGISKEIEELVTTRISIPRFGASQATESLNVATATAILLSEFRRK